ncbi:MAG TPA: sigma-70 family RNA polymerase sigma factor [Terriglobales bacterium]|nr:sigma-70 family RNA polymerase sigma factor [Terriglobales bacterium]
MAASAHQVTELLASWSRGDVKAREELIPLVYAELRRLANSYLRRERSDHTLQPTALVHEAYLRLIAQREIHWKDKGHFFAITAQLMRRILVDHARGHLAEKRGSGMAKVPLDDALVMTRERPGKLLALDESLSRLAQVDPRQAQIVELRVFAGLSVEEAAEFLGISLATVKRDWRMAKAWLSREIEESRDS